MRCWAFRWLELSSIRSVGDGELALAYTDFVPCALWPSMIT